MGNIFKKLEKYLKGSKHKPTLKPDNTKMTKIDPGAKIGTKMSKVSVPGGTRLSQLGSGFKAFRNK